MESPSPCCKMGLPNPQCNQYISMSYMHDSAISFGNTPSPWPNLGWITPLGRDLTPRDYVVPMNEAIMNLMEVLKA